jgi:uncharacterized protein
MRSPLLLLFHFLLISLFASAQSTVGSLPNQKLIDNSYVSNPDQLLDANTVANIDTQLKTLEDSTSVQIAVVVVKSIGEANVFDFAQQLFETWGIGNKENDNGLLILFVEDQREIRFHTGNGLEGVLPDVICKQIQRNFMVPHFKEGRYADGMLAGIGETVKILTDPAYFEELRNSGTIEDPNEWESFIMFLMFFVVPTVAIAYFVRAKRGQFTNSKNRSELNPRLHANRWTWLFVYIVIPIIIVVLLRLSGTATPFGDGLLLLYTYFLFTRFYRMYREKQVLKSLVKQENYYEAVEFIRSKQWYWVVTAIVFPLPFFFYVFYYFARKRIYRNHSRNCKKCQNEMKKLNDVNEDEYLSESQLMEEKLRTVDYDVWKCVSCNTIEASFYLGNQSKFESCPKCTTIAYYSASTRTIESATYSSSGTGEETRECKYCGHKKKLKYTISQLRRSESSSSSSSSSSFSSGSSGGSWGGGSSGGGGASSKW